MLSRFSPPPNLDSAAKTSLRLLAFWLGLICLCLAAIHAFTFNAMPATADGLLHLYRTVAVEHSLRVDHPLWPRFSSGLVYGYGAPLFNFFPPPAYFPSSLLRSLGLNFVGAWLLSMCAFTVMAGAGMYLLGRLWTRSALGGWFAAAAYVYSPYLLFDSVTRGATAELAALAALPYAFYGLTRLAFAGGRRDFLIALAALCLFIPLHTVITLHGAALLAFYCLFLAWRAPDRLAVLLRLGLAGALALMLTAFYWLPALAERETIKLPLIAEQLGHIDATRHLRPLAEVFALPLTADPTQQNQALPISLGWLQLILAAFGALLSFRASNRRYLPLMLVSAAALAFLVFLNTPPAAWLWENIPLIGFTQFPWRILGLASLLLALMGAVGAQLLRLSLGAGWGSLAFICGLALAVLVYGLPWTFTSFQDDIAVDDIADLQRFEREGGQLALSSYAEYLPVSADANHLDADRLLARFDESDVIPRLLPSPSVEIVAQEWHGTSAALRLRLAKAQTLVFDWLHVPGWAASIDGARVDVFPSRPAGLVALAAPAGELELRLSLEPTAAQSLAGAFGGIGLAAATLTALLWRRLMPATTDLRSSGDTEWHWLLMFAAIGIAVFLLKALALDASDTPFRHSRFGNVGEAPALANFGDKIDLLALDAPAEAIQQPAGTFKLYWRLQETPVDRDYSSVIRMRDPQGLVVAEASAFAPGNLATSNWRAGAYIEDVIEFEIPPFTPPLSEAYAFEIALYDSETLRPISLINAAGDPQGVRFEIKKLPLRRGDLAANAPPPPATDADEVAQLREASGLPSAATAGDSLRFSWAWRKLRASASDAMAQVIWLDNAGDEAAAAPALPLVYGYNIADWRNGEINRGHHQLIVPASLPAGSYGLAIRAIDASGKALAPAIQLDQTMTVAVPQRRFEAPRYDFDSGAEWDNGIVLHGFSLNAIGEVELVWGTDQVLSESLRLFVHALDADGGIAAQWDGVPVDWTRPTTGWIAGEYLITKRRFSLPAGEYRLRLGWYAPLTGERVSVAGADALELAPRLRIE